MAAEINSILKEELEKGQRQFNNFINVTFRSSDEDYNRDDEDLPDSRAEEELYALLEHVYASIVQGVNMIPPTEGKIEGDTAHFLDPEEISDFNLICWGGFYAARFHREHLQHQRAGKLSAAAKARKASRIDKQREYESEAKNLAGLIASATDREERIQRINEVTGDIDAVR